MSQVEYHKRGRIAIFFPAPNLGALQPLLDASILLAENGYLVEFYTLSHPFHPRPISKHPGIVINTECSEMFLDGGVGIPKLVYGKDGRFIRWGGKLFHWGGRIIHWFATTFYRPMMRHRFDGLFRNNHKALPYVCFIGMNRFGQGLIEAASYAEKLNIPLINWCLELSFMAEQQNEKQRKRKIQEIDCSRKAVFSIIQDQWRAQALADENGLPFSEMVLVPVAPMGIARRKPDRSYRERLGIPAGKKIILCTGNIGYTTMNLEIIEAANNLPDDYILVMQSRQSPSPKYDYSTQMVLRANPEKVKLFFDPVPTENYRALVDAADVGICLYRACFGDSPKNYSKNMEVMGLSSGKLSDYLYSGLPVIVNDMIGPKELVVANECGKWLSDPGDLEMALKEIFLNYDYYSNNACRCFNDKLELSRFFQPVIERISRL
jgi:glycosyltransferase involved in cell wall biosynthesis